MKEVLHKIFTEVDRRILQEVEEARSRDELPRITTPVELRVVGQMALLLGDVPIPVAGTTDLDAMYRADAHVSQLLREQLLAHGLVLESDQQLIWMPDQTQYRVFYDGLGLRALIAEPISVIASKCKFRRRKDRPLLVAYFAACPGSRSAVTAMGIATDWVDI